MNEIRRAATEAANAEWVSTHCLDSVIRAVQGVPRVWYLDDMVARNPRFSHSEWPTISPLLAVHEHTDHSGNVLSRSCSIPLLRVVEEDELAADLLAAIQVEHQRLAADVECNGDERSEISHTWGGGDYRD